MSFSFLDQPNYDEGEGETDSYIPLPALAMLSRYLLCTLWSYIVSYHTISNAFYS